MCKRFDFELSRLERKSSSKAGERTFHKVIRKIRKDQRVGFVGWCAKSNKFLFDPGFVPTLYYEQHEHKHCIQFVFARLAIHSFNLLRVFIRQK